MKQRAKTKEQRLSIKAQSLKKAYIFSGLGADERVFKYLDFKDLDVTFIQWIKPKFNEPLTD